MFCTGLQGLHNSTPAGHSSQFRYSVFVTKLSRRPWLCYSSTMRLLIMWYCGLAFLRGFSLRYPLMMTRPVAMFSALGGWSLQHVITKRMLVWVEEIHKMIVPLAR
eukprot:scaffold34573_cov40-Prasinocladus_malaysianus.AAC.1